MIKFPRNLLKDIINKALSSKLQEIAAFANSAKNARHYHAGQDVVMSCIFTGQIIAVDRRDISLAPHLILNGMWEEALTKYCQELVAQKANPIIFDVGANFGWYGLTLSRFSGGSTVHFFEANPSMIPLLHKTVLVNGLALRSRVINCAVSSSSGENVEIHIPSMHKGSASTKAFNLDLADYHENLADVDVCIVNGISLDDYCSSAGISSVDFIKLDVEGGEGDVLIGAKKTIANSGELVIMMEWNRRRYADAILPILKVFGKCQTLQENGEVIDLSPVLAGSSTVAEFEAAIERQTGQKTSHFDLFFLKTR